MAILQTAPNAWPTLRAHRTQLGLYDFKADEVAVRLVPVTYAGARTRVAAVEGEACPDFVNANHGDWDYARVDFNRNAVTMLGEHIAAFADPLTRLMLWQGVYDMVLRGQLSPFEFIDIALANVEAEGADDVARKVLAGLQGSWSYLKRLVEDPELLGRTAARIEGYLWQAFLDSEPGSDRQLMLFDQYTAAAMSERSLDRLAGLLAGDEPPAGFVFDQDRRWNVVELLSGFDHPGAAASLAAERERDLSDDGRRWVLAVQAARPDPEHHRRLVRLLLDPDPELTVADARAHASGLFPDHQHDLQLGIAGEVLNRLLRASDRLDPRYFGPISNGLLGTVCNTDYLEMLERALIQTESLHPSLKKRLLNLRFEIRRCLAIGEALATPP